MAFIDRATIAGVSYTDFVVDYTRSTLNFIQMRAWQHELPEALDRLDGSKPAS